MPKVFINIRLPTEMYISLIDGVGTITRLLVSVVAHLNVIEKLAIRRAGRNQPL